MKLGHKLAAVMALMLAAMMALNMLSFIDTKTSALDDRAIMTKRLTEVALMTR